MALNDIYMQTKISEGNIAEFEKLFMRFYEPLCRHAFTFVKDMDASEDIVQEFFYHLWENHGSFTPKLALSAYLYNSIRNNALRYLQHQSMREAYATKSAIRERYTLVNDDPLDLQVQELDAIIEHTLRQMPPRCSKIFRMNRFEGKKYREIAEMLSVSMKTVEADMGKALQIFRKALSDYTTQRAG